MASDRAGARAEGEAARLIYLVTEDWYFWAHRLPQARAARDAGFRVAVATRVTRHGALIESEGFVLHPLGWRRGSTNILAGLAAVLEVVRLYRRERPQLVHHVSQKPILIGSIAARLAGVGKIVNALTGLGFLFTASTLKARLLRSFLLPLFRNIAGRPGVRFLVENPDDGALLRRLDVVPSDNILLIRGSGVDTEHYRPLPEPPEGSVTIACATRMLRIKGVAEVVEAFRLARTRTPGIRLLLAGAPDVENPAAIPLEDLRRWAAEPGIEWVGHVDDIRQVWARAHVAVLASHGGEGIPMTLMEAAACGRPLIATDVPGCREIVRTEETGILVNANDVTALAGAFERMATDDAFRRRCGQAARGWVERGLDARTVGRETVAVYRDLLGSHA